MCLLFKKKKPYDVDEEEEFLAMLEEEEGEDCDD